MSEMIDLTNVDLGVENLGEMWSDFIERCTPEHATQYNQAYNLIAISFPDSFIDSTITHLLVDEALGTADLMAHIRILFIDTIIDALQIMGIIVDKDWIDPNSLPDLCNILDTIYLADGLTDLIGLVETLNDEEADAKERFIRVVRMVQPQYDMENMEYYIKDVSTNVIRGLLIGLNIIDEDDETWVDPDIQKRVKTNKDFIKVTLAGTHIMNGGGVGQAFETYMNLFINELGMQVIDGTIGIYLENVLGLMLISHLTDTEIQGQFNSLIEQYTTTVEEAYKAQSILNKVKLNA
ncbi:hypothetical protein D5W64_13100 [Salmonella enterica subsp. enterica serovar Saintpaul]|nr:hypothetical protein [Salmonella enterica subsp. enterica serovar Saintpaul]